MQNAGSTGTGADGSGAERQQPEGQPQGESHVTAEASAADLGQIPQVRRDGSEQFHNGGSGLGVSLVDFWAWSASDIVSNATRGVLAEYIVASAVGAVGSVRDEWAAYDLKSPYGTTIEVKSAAYIQSWHQVRHSLISFSCPKTRALIGDTNQYSEVAQRQAQVYVFALLAHKEQATLDPLDVSQWEFFVVPTVVLDERKRSQASITINSLRALHGASVTFGDLGEAVERAAEIHNRV